jgi:hypothetical protein
VPVLSAGLANMSSLSPEGAGLSEIEKVCPAFHQRVLAFQKLKKFRPEQCPFTN